MHDVLLDLIKYHSFTLSCDYIIYLFIESCIIDIQNVLWKKQSLWQTDFLGKEICWVSFDQNVGILANSIGIKIGPICGTLFLSLLSTKVKSWMWELEILSLVNKCTKKDTKISLISISHKLWSMTCRPNIKRKIMKNPSSVA